MRHNGCHQKPRECLFNHSFRRRSKKTYNLRVTGLCVGNSPHKKASNAENVFIWWRQHDIGVCILVCFLRSISLKHLALVTHLCNNELVHRWVMFNPHQHHDSVLTHCQHGLYSLSITVSYRKISWSLKKPQDWGLEFSIRSHIWRGHRQQRCDHSGQWSF